MSGIMATLSMGPQSARGACFCSTQLSRCLHLASPAAEHFVDELEVELADTLLEDFQVEAEDGSPAQVKPAVSSMVSHSAAQSEPAYQVSHSGDQCQVTGNL